MLSHYHAVRVLGASGYPAHEIICSDVTRDLIVERGQQDMDSEIGRFPRLFRGREGIPGLTWPTHTFHGRMSLWLGEREAQVIHIGRAHTAGDTIVWMPKEKVLFAGDTVEFGATPYCGDAHFTDWPETHPPAARARRREDGARPRPRAAERAEVAEGAGRHRGVHLAPCSRLVRDGVAQGLRRCRRSTHEAMDKMRPRLRRTG